MAGDLKTKYGSTGVTVTCGFQGVTSNNGRISAAVDNSGNLFSDVLLTATVKTGATAPSGNKQIMIFGLGSVDGSTYTDGYAIGDAATSVVPVNARPIMVIAVASTATTYVGGPASVAASFGGVMPQSWGFLAFNDSGQTVNSSASNFIFSYQGVQGQYT